MVSEQENEALRDTNGTDEEQAESGSQPDLGPGIATDHELPHPIPSKVITHPSNVLSLI